MEEKSFNADTLFLSFSYDNEIIIEANQAMVNREGRFRGFIKVKRKFVFPCTERYYALPTGLKVKGKEVYRLYGDMSEVKEDIDINSIFQKVASKARHDGELLGYTTYGKPLVPKTITFKDTIAKKRVKAKLDEAMRRDMLIVGVTYPQE